MKFEGPDGGDGITGIVADDAQRLHGIEMIRDRFNRGRIVPVAESFLRQLLRGKYRFGVHLTVGAISAWPMKLAVGMP